MQANYIIFPAGKLKYIVLEETSQRKKMPYRYTDVNIKLHQYQGWKSGGL